MNDQYYSARAQIIKAMAHPSRLQIIVALTKGELCVCELKKLVGADMSTVSKHLSLMKAAGIVQDRKEGLQVFYRLLCPCVETFLNCIDTLIDGQRDKFNACSKVPVGRSKSIGIDTNKC